MIRRSLQRSLAASRCIRRHVFVGYKLPPMPAKMEKPGENSWLQFFVSSRFEIEFDLDRTLLNLQEGEVDEYAVRFIMQNYEGFKSYQIVRALLFIRSYEIKSKMINRLLDLIVEGDKELYPQDLEVICLLKLPHFQLNPMLREFVIYNIAKHFNQQDLLVKSLCMGYLLRINKISDELLNAYLDSLEQAETSLEKPLTQLFSEWKLQHKLNFIFTLQFVELILKPHDKISLVRRIRDTCFESVMTQFSNPTFLKSFINFESQSLQEFSECFVLAYGEARLKMIDILRNLLITIEDGLEEDLLNTKRRFSSDMIAILTNNLTQSEKEYMRQKCQAFIDPIATARLPLSCIKLLNSLELVNKRVINSFIADSLKRAIKSDVMLDQTKNHSPLLKLGILHDLNIRESFMPSEATQQTWEQLKRQIYRTLFHRIVSFDTRQTLQQILETAKSPNLESSGSLATLTMPCLVNSERVFQEIKGYTDVMERTAVKKNASGGFFDLQKMFDKDVISFQDPEERVILAADIDSDKLTEIKEAEGSTDSADELDGEESEAAEIKKREDQHGEIIEMIRAININTHNVYSPIRNQHTCNIYFKYRNLANYFSLCATLICDSPKSIAKTDLGPITTFLSAPEVYELVNLLGSHDKTIPLLLDIYRWDSSVIQNPKLVTLLEAIICYSDSVLNDKSKNDMMALVSNAYEASKSTDAQLQDHIVSQHLFFPANVPLEDKKQSDLVKQLEFKPSVDVYRLTDADNKLSDTVVIKHILSKNTLFLRMINQSVLYTCTEHQLKSEGLAFSKNVWAYPYMADFVIAKESSIKVLGAEKAVPIAVFVADVGSRQVGMSDLTRYSISQSKRYFAREGYMVITIQPENFKLRKNNQELIKDLIKSVESYTNFTN